MPEVCTSHIKYDLEPRIVRVYTDEALLSFLNQSGKRDALRLAEQLRSDYQRRFGQPLEISSDSIAIEILVHVCIDQLTKQLKSGSVPLPLSRLLTGAAERLHRRTAVIDIGEQAVDSNRLIFDAMVPFKTALYQLLD